MDPDTLDLLDRAARQVSTLLSEVDFDRVDRPTPCRSWRLPELIGHILGDLPPFIATARGEKPDYSAPTEGAGPDAARVFDARAGYLLEAWREAASGDGPDDAQRAGQAMQVAELTVHGWDLAAALEHPVGDLDPALAEFALAMLQAQLEPEYRGSEDDGMFFGPEIAAPPDAAPYERLAAFAGRDPRWRA